MVMEAIFVLFSFLAKPVLIVWFDSIFFKQLRKNMIALVI